MSQTFKVGDPEWAAEPNAQTHVARVGVRLDDRRMFYVYTRVLTEHYYDAQLKERAEKDLVFLANNEAIRRRHEPNP